MAKDYIHAINEVYDLQGIYDGYEVVTTNNVYKVLIENDRQCCEDWGYACTEDCADDYIGAELLGIRLTDTQRGSMVVGEFTDGKFCHDNIQFVDFITNEGVFQLAVYNDHNGYYGHDILLIKNDEELFQGVL